MPMTSTAHPTRGRRVRGVAVAVAFAPAWLSAVAIAQTVPDGPPLARLDLTTREGVDLIGGAWRYSDVEIVETDFTAAGPDGQPGGPTSIRSQPR